MAIQLLLALLAAASLANDGELQAPFTARAVEWRIPIGCDFSGFFVEVALGP